MSKTAAERQKAYRDKKRNAPSKTSVTLPDATTTIGPLRALHGAIVRNAPKVTAEDAPQSTNGGGVVVEHPPRSRLVPIPGDSDYVGCCKLVDGEWTVDNSKPDVKAMSTDELIRRLHYIKDWQRSPEHLEVMRRRGSDGGLMPGVLTQLVSRSMARPMGELAQQYADGVRAAL